MRRSEYEKELAELRAEYDKELTELREFQQSQAREWSNSLAKARQELSDQTERLETAKEALSSLRVQVTSLKAELGAYRNIAELAVRRK